MIKITNKKVIQYNIMVDISQSHPNVQEYLEIGF